MNWRAFAGCAALALAGCETSAGFQQMADSYVGHPEAQLVGGLGVPTSVYVVDGTTKILTFAHSGQAFIGGATPMLIGMSCSLNMTVVNGWVTSWSATGNHCKAKPL
jgi:hypothetical protein